MVSIGDSTHKEQPAPENAEFAATVTALVAQVRSIVEQSGRPEGFDAELWLNRWLRTPVPALGNRPPIEFLSSPEGVALVMSVLSKMQSGAYM